MQFGFTGIQGPKHVNNENPQTSTFCFGNQDPLFTPIIEPPSETQDMFRTPQDKRPNPDSQLERFKKQLFKGQVEESSLAVP